MQRLTFFTLVLLALCASCFAQSIPSVKGKTLNNSDIILPKPGGTQNLILVLGFSHKSGDTCTPWDKRLFVDYHSDAQVTYYQLPVLEGAPSFVRPMILRGMRKDIPVDRKSTRLNSSHRSLSRMPSSA